MSAAYFCTETGARIAAPGVCKAVDPVNGQDEFSEPAPVGESTTEPAPVGDHIAPTRARKG